MFMNVFPSVSSAGPMALYDRKLILKIFPCIQVLFVAVSLDFGLTRLTEICGLNKT